MTYDDTLTINDLLALGSCGASISNEYYHQLDGLSGSALTLLEESPRHYENKSLFSMGDQSHFALGSCVHELVLEPYMSSYSVMPNFDGRTTQGKADKAAWMVDNANKIVIPADDYDKAVKMARNVLAICGDIFENSINERSLFVEYQPNIILKCRIDAQYKNDDFDLKTISPKDGLSEWEMLKNSEKFGYFRSAALRCIVREALGMPVGNCFLVFVSTSPGHLVKIRKIPEDAIITAKYQCYDLIEKWGNFVHYGLESPIKEMMTRGNII